MKRMKNFFFVVLLISTASLFGQTAEEDRSVKVKVIKTSDGETVVFDTVVWDVDEAERLVELKLQKLEGEEGELEVKIMGELEELDKELEKLRMDKEGMDVENKELKKAERIIIRTSGDLDEEADGIRMKIDLLTDSAIDGPMELQFDLMLDSLSGKDGNIKRKVIIMKGDEKTILEGEDGEHHEIETLIAGEGEGDVRIIKVTMRRARILDLDMEAEPELENLVEEIGLKKTTSLELDNLKFYPNPSDGLFTLEAGLKSNTDLQLTIFNLDGKLVKDVTIPGSDRHILKEIDLREQPAGTYLLVLEQDGASLNKKVILK